MTLQVINGPVIEAGQSLSNAIDCTAGQMVRITAPAAWTPARITFQISSDGVTFNDYVDRFGVEYMATILPGTAIGFRSDFSKGAAFIKFRSGVRVRPVAQAERREFAVAIDVAPWRPNLADIPGLQAWYDPTNAGRMSVDHLGGIDMLIPSLGNAAAYTLRQDVEANRPQSLAIAPNGKRVIACPEGDTRWLSAAADMARDSGLSLIIAWNVIDNATTRGICNINRIGGSGPQRTDLAITEQPPSLAYRYGDFGGDFGQASRPVQPNAWSITTTSDRLSWLNGGDAQALSAGSLNPETGCTIELGRFGTGFAGLLGHWLIITGPVSPDILRKIEGFIAWDLGFEGNLAAGHPWKNTRP